MTNSSVLQIRCSAKEKERWQQAAEDQGQSLSAWLKGAADAAADFARQDMNPGFQTKRNQVVADSKTERKKDAGAGCPAYHVRGVRCKLCGKTG